jgi:hypothetical protein
MAQLVTFVASLLFAFSLAAQEVPRADISTVIQWTTTDTSEQTIDVHHGDWVTIHLTCKPVFPWRCGGAASYFVGDQEVEFDDLYDGFEDKNGFTHEAFGVLAPNDGEMDATVYVPVLYRGATYNLTLEVVSAQ